ncbi:MULTISPECIES: hypothetical protein [unclassified Streptomyces]|uniref:hypothetical protein n=1 Tax=unclassified Streptomyces TaxID=2593676 RepID=UPI002E76A529|nr:MULTISPECIES: hypothetical protein [unclassified Streptomyces]MEE1761628.1 hypothetical protein [Streptomyces sp. SP18BB07]MEE1834202.1 hypothetical protein [Streptomyces sp. SP17KL33]
MACERPVPLSCTASALESERRTRLRRLRTAGAAVLAASGGGDAEPERRPVAVRQAPDDSSIGTWATEKVFAKGVGDYVQGFTQHGDKSQELYKLDFPAHCAR